MYSRIYIILYLASCLFYFFFSSNFLQFIIMVIDSTDRERLAVTREELYKMLQHEDLAKASLLVYANKQVKFIQWLLNFFFLEVFIRFKYFTTLLSLLGVLLLFTIKMREREDFYFIVLISSFFLFILVITMFMSINVKNEKLIELHF